MPNFVNPSTTIIERGVVSCTFTPAASSHIAFDCIGGAKTVTLSGCADRIIRPTGYRLSLATTTPITTVYTAVLFSSTPSVIADDAPFVISTADGAKVAGYIPIAQPIDYLSTWIEGVGGYTGPPVQMGTTDILTVYLMNTTTVTTEAVAFNFTLFYDF